jgi:hypothetical protein
MLLFERHREVIFRVACRLTNSTAAAEDITQECFLGLLNAPGRFDPAKGSLRTSRALELPGCWNAHGRQWMRTSIVAAHEDFDCRGAL